MGFFTINKCKLTGCIYNRQSKCALNGIKIVQVANALMLNHDSDICQAKQQLNTEKMENILNKKTA